MFGHQDEPVKQVEPEAVQPPAAPVDNTQTAEVFNPALPPADMNFGMPTATAPVPEPALAAAPITDTHNLLETQADDGYVVPAVAEIQPSISGAPDSTFESLLPDQADQQAISPTLGAQNPLHDLKQQALQQLTPLVGQLEQSAEERFRTTMMMIQASDNQDLLQAAYDAANQIEDERIRAQALLDVINEINYFAQQQKG